MMEVGSAGYPFWSLTVVIVIGIVIAIRSSFWGGVFSFLLISTADFYAFVHTRFPDFGPYFNLLDACLMIAVIAVLFHAWATGRVPLVPSVFWGMLICIALGMILGMLINGLGVEVGRSRYRLTNLAFIALGSNVLWEKKRLDTLITIILLATILQSGRQIFFFVSSVAGGSPWNAARGAFLATGGGALFAAAIFYFGKNYRYLRLLSFSALGLALIALIFRQTRSELVSVIFGFGTLALFMVFPRYRRLRVLRRVAAVILTIGLFFVLSSRLVTFNYNPLIILTQSRITHLGGVTGTKTGRLEDANAEFQAWIDGNIILGEGFFYERADRFERLRRDYPQASWRHIGVLAVLARLGLVGFFVFFVWLPKAVFSCVLPLAKSENDKNRLAVIAFVASSLMKVLTMSLMAPGIFSNAAPVFAVFFGIIWRWRWQMRVDNKSLMRRTNDVERCGYLSA